MMETIYSSQSQAEGTITTTVDGSHIGVTVSLRRAWAVTQGKGSYSDVRWLAERLYRIWYWLNTGLKIALILGLLLVMFEVGWAFRPGGAVDQTIGGYE